MISAAREMVARFAGLGWWRDPYKPSPATDAADMVLINEAHAIIDASGTELVALLSDLIEADTPRPKPVAARPAPDDAPPMTDPSVGDKRPAGFMPAHMDPAGPFGHLPTGRDRPGHDHNAKTPWAAAWARLTPEEQA